MFDAQRHENLLASLSATYERRRTLAAKLVSVFDLTSLNPDDSPSLISGLCHKALTPVGPVAALCVSPRFLPICWKTLPGESDVKAATVVAFPAGTADAQHVANETADAIALGADEVDMVFNANAFLNGEPETAATAIAAAAAAIGTEARLKVILETGLYDDKPEAVYEASMLALDAGADFLQTSTGKIKSGATPGAVAAMAMAIIDAGAEDAGIKVSGGVRDVDQATSYFTLVHQCFGGAEPTRDRFRIGGGSLLGALLEAALPGTQAD